MSQFQIICLRCIWFSSNVPIMQRFLLFFFPYIFVFFALIIFFLYSSVIAGEMQSKFQQNKQNNVDLQ